MAPWAKRSVVGGTLGAAAIVAAVLVLVSSEGDTPRPRHHATTTTTTTSTNPPAAQPAWHVTWGSAMAWGSGTASNATVRDLATVATGGQAVRVRVSNLFGNAPLVIGAASLGVSAGGPALVPGTLRPISFSGQPAVTVPVGGLVYSDAVPMAVGGGETLAISVFTPASDLVTVHPCCTRIVGYVSPNGGGNLVTSVDGRGLSIASPWERWVDAVDVLETGAPGSIVVVGDSITEGFNATLRWTDVLQQRIDALPAAEQRAVVNEGITANALTSGVHTDSATGGGPSGVSRLARDALDQAGVSEVVLFLGTNDLWFGATADQVVAGYQQAIAATHQAGLRIVGVTLLPRGSTADEPWSARQQAALEQVDRWILTSGAFDGVLDLSAAVSNVYGGACAPTQLFPAYDSGDHLHPNAAGQTAMADAVDASVLQVPTLPPVPALVATVPTPGCSGATS
jgi:lysophospholipase L1-like esterase